MVRQGLAVLLGFTVWSALWLICNSVLVELHALPHERSTAIQDAGPLLALLISATLTTLACGYAVAMVSASHAQRSALILSIVLLAVGVVVQAQYWHLMPLWYHVAFLGLLMPVCLAGAGLHRPD